VAPPAAIPDRARRGVRHRPLSCPGTTRRPPRTWRSAANPPEQERHQQPSSYGSVLPLMFSRCMRR
jgi:hypothetical protein